jgi:hypothetical protein
MAKYNQNDQVKKDEMGRANSAHRDKRNVYKILVENPDGKRPLRRPRRTWKNNIKRILLI